MEISEEKKEMIDRISNITLVNGKRLYVDEGEVLFELLSLLEIRNPFNWEDLYNEILEKSKVCDDGMSVIFSLQEFKPYIDEHALIINKLKYGIEYTIIAALVCKKCGKDNCVYSEGVKQTRSADEAMTSFYKCSRCGYDWRV